jgi:NAD(P)-dependent dehydrogenase (short-subunit alcohol dehydrogenase family)
VRSVLITGCSTGIGRATALRLDAAGWVVFAGVRKMEDAEDLAAAGSDRLEPLIVDVADGASIDVARDRVAAAAPGGLDGLVNNAGVGATAPALRTPTDTFARVVDVNLIAPFALSCLAAQHMRSGGGRSIVNIASVMGLRSIGEIPDAAYVASKAGIIGLTRELASQWGRYGIRVNAVAPGFFASEMTAELGDDPEEFPDFLLSRTPLGRGGRTGELDEAVLFLLDGGSSFVTGHVLSVDGGMAVR